MQEYINFFQANPILSLSWVGLFIAVVVMTVKIRLSTVSNIDSHQLTMLINREDAKVIDVRPKEEFKKGHIVNAINVPLAQIKNKQLANIEKFKNTPIILVCSSGITSGQAAQMLAKEGFSQLSNLKGGMGEWQAANMPIQKSKR